MTYERKNIKAMSGYVSGEQPDTADIIKLNTNENPFPPGPAVAQALEDVSVNSLRRYPPPTAYELSQVIADYHNIAVDNVLVTNGGDELLRLIIATFVDTEQAIAVAEPSYSLYEVLAAAHGCEVIRFELDDNWQLPNNFASQLNDSGAKVFFIPNPHAPSGLLLPVTELRQLARDFNGVLVIDEAYVDFVDPECAYDGVPLINEFENVLILRTFSKGYSLAGLRMAYGLGAKSLIDPIQYKTKDSYNTDFIAQKLAQAAITDHSYAANTWANVREQRAIMNREFQALNFSTTPSQSNFLLVTIPAPYNAEVIYQALKDQGILVRYFNTSRLADSLRITMGTEKENQALITALKGIISGYPS